MCTAIACQTGDFYFGRNLDYEFSYGEKVVLTPRRYPFVFRKAGSMTEHYAFLGMAHIADGYPLYYDGVNEKGLCIAGLNFVGNAFYPSPTEAKAHTLLAPFEFIPYLLGKCASVAEARELLSDMALVHIPFSDTFPPSPLHYMLADATECITIEPVKEGLMVYDNPVGVLTNNPPFPMQLLNLSNYTALSRKQPVSSFADGFSPTLYSRGMGAIGLPGDVSSMSRFVRAAFAKMNSVCEPGEKESVNQFFHLLGCVEQVRGMCEVAPGQYEITIYSSCMNATRGIYYYTTYEDRQIKYASLMEAPTVLAGEGLVIKAEL